MKRLIIVVALLGVLSAAATALAAGGRPITEKVLGAARISQHYMAAPATSHAATPQPAQPHARPVSSRYEPKGKPPPFRADAAGGGKCDALCPPAS